MKAQILVLIICICVTQFSFSQEENGVVALNIPIRNSLTFNRYVINPTFSFVREQNKYISLYNKREWVQFDNAPQTYLTSYTGRFAENIGASVGLFQQNHGVLTTFGGVLNFAYNARLATESNLTFGLNLGAYKSGINTGNVITNFDDPILQSVPDNFIMTINPGINYGISLFDFGVSVNNLVTYNFKSSELIEDNPEQSVQAHIMYTGYMNSGGFFDQTKFTGILRSEFKKEETIISGMAMLTVPKGIWAQVGYNTIYGVSGGIGLNITPEIAIEYNFEKSIGNLSDFGSSHDITLAFRLKNRERYYYGSDDEVVGLISNHKKRNPVIKISKEKAEENRKRAAERRTRIQAEREAATEANMAAQTQAKLIEEQKAKEEADTKAKLLKEQKAKKEADAQAKLLVEQKAKEEADAKAKLLEEQKAKKEADTKAKLLEEQKAKKEADAQAKLLVEQKAKEEADAKARLLEEQKAKEEADAKARLLEEQKAKEEADAKVRLLEEQKAKEEADAKAKLIEEQKAKEEAQAKLIEEQKVKEEADAKAKLIEEQKAKEEAQAKLIEEQKVKEELITNPQDELGKAMNQIAQKTEDSKTRQDDLLNKFDDIVEIKNQDLNNLKEENDLSEQGILVAPIPFKSITEENNRLNAIILDLDEIIETRNQEIEELKKLYDDNYKASTINLDEVVMFYKNAIERLEAEQIQTIDAKLNLELRLEDINVATEFERNRRIKRAAFDNEEERYAQDRATLLNIKRNIEVISQPYNVDDFNFGDERSGNIVILKNINNVESAYYLIIAVHTDTDDRDEFVKKVVASGRADVDFFFDVNTSKYHIYYDKFGSINEANRALSSKENKPYNSKMTLIKVEN